MRKSCCIADVDISPKSSCSMVLRSACIHKHSSTSSLTVSGVQIRESTPKPREQAIKENQKQFESINSDNFVEIGSLLKSSLKEIDEKSAQEYKLKKNLYHSFEFSQNGNYQVYQSHLVNTSCAKELHYSGISVSSDSTCNDSALSKEKCSDYSSAVKSDLNHNISESSTSKMPVSQRLTRSSVSSMRTLSGSESESEEESSLTESGLRGRRADLPLRSTGERSSVSYHERNFNNVHSSSISSSSHFTSSNSNLNFNSRGNTELDQRNISSESSRRNSSNVQYSFLDRFRWFLWRCIYLKLVRNINFDVWCLSRLHNFGKFKAVLILSLAIFLLLLWGFIHKEWHCLDSPVNIVSSTFSSITTQLSSAFSSFHSSLEDEGVSELHLNGHCSSESEGFTIFSSLSTLSGMISGYFSRSEESSSTSQSIPHPHQSLNQFSKEEIRALAMEVFKKEASDVVLKFQKSFINLDQSVRQKESENKLKMEFDKLQLEFKSLAEVIRKLEKDLDVKFERNAQSENAKDFEHKKHFDFVNAKLKNIEMELEALREVKKCCDQKWNPEQFRASLESSVVAALKSVTESESSENSKYKFLHDWLNSKFIDRESLTKEIDIALQKFKNEQQTERFSQSDAEKMIEIIVKNYIDSLKLNFTLLSSSGSVSSARSSDLNSEENVLKIVKEAIMLYDADKTGRADYALESGGGSVIGTRCTEAYVEKNGKFSIFGLPIWSFSNSPRVSIQPGMQPGQCWAFKGSQGFLVLELSSTIYPTGFTLEHIPVSLSPSGSIDSAPKDFSVWGLSSETDNAGKLLGKYVYKIDGEPLQYFPVQESVGEGFQFVELKVLSNYGNLDYTCLYRFRVHGKRVQ